MTRPRRIALFGECMIELRGQAFGTLQQGFGGDTLNTAVYLARLCRNEDILVSYATALGTDSFSDHMIAAWRSETIDTSLVRRLDDRLPGLYAIQVDPSGERHFLYWREASAARSYFNVPHTPLEEAAADGLSAFYLSGISLAILPPEGRERLLAVQEMVRANGGMVVFDNNFRPRLWPAIADAQPIYERAYALSDIVLVTLDDEVALWGENADRALTRVLALEAPEVVVKQGAEPTLVRAAEAPPISVAAEPIPRVVDTTAAGDSFAGAYLAMRLMGMPPVAAARAANRLAAVVIQHPGAIIPANAMPTPQTLLAPEETHEAYIHPIE
jgi:2-dehydro-3-deoxygluconokinase